jgi:hypothetical protein
VKAEGGHADREWPLLSTIIDTLISRFNAHMTEIQSSGTRGLVGELRAKILAHARGKATVPRGYSHSMCQRGAAKRSPRSALRLIMPKSTAWTGSSMASRSPRLSTRLRQSFATCQGRSTFWSITQRSRTSARIANHRSGRGSARYAIKCGSLWRIGPRRVAPFTGARIETFWYRWWPDRHAGRSLHGSADRNGDNDPRAAWGEVAPFTGARIETSQRRAA